MRVYTSAKKRASQTELFETLSLSSSNRPVRLFAGCLELWLLLNRVGRQRRPRTVSTPAGFTQTGTALHAESTLGLFAAVCLFMLLALPYAAASSLVCTVQTTALRPESRRPWPTQASIAIEMSFCVSGHVCVCYSRSTEERPGRLTGPAVAVHAKKH